MNLILVFTLVSIFLIILLVFLYFFRKKYTPKKYKNNDDLDLFLKDLKLYMTHHHPKININYSFIEKMRNENNLEIKEALIIENIVDQFISYNYKKTTKKGLPKENYWASYLEKSLSNPKLPNDWVLRRDFAWRRENKCCDRCGENIELDESHTVFVNEIKNGGGYNLENMITLCVNCNKILNNRNSKTIISSLPLTDNLMMIIK